MRSKGPKKGIRAEFQKTDAANQLVPDLVGMMLALEEKSEIGKDVRAVEYG